MANKKRAMALSLLGDMMTGFVAEFVDGVELIETGTDV